MSDTPSTLVHADRIVFVGYDRNGAQLTTVFMQLTRSEIDNLATVAVDVPIARRLRYAMTSRDLSGMRPGAVYAVTIEGGSVKFTKKSWPVDYVPDAIVFPWQAASRAEKHAFDAVEKLKKEGERNVVKETLEPLRQLYRQSRGATRAQLLAEIVAYIVGGV